MLRHASLPYRMALLSPVADFFEPNVKMNIRSLLLGATLMLGTQAVSSCHPVKPDWEQRPVHEFMCAESTVPSRRMTNDLKANTPRLPPFYCMLQHLRGQEQPRKLMAMAFEEYHSYLFSTINAFRAVSTQRYTRLTSKAHGTIPASSAREGSAHVQIILSSLCSLCVQNYSLPELCHHESLMASANTTVNMVVRGSSVCVNSI